jgi:error-prone DNA polymerase
MGFYSVNTLMQDAKRHGVLTKPISVEHSMITTEVIADNTLRLGLHRLKGLRQ